MGGGGAAPGCPLDIFPITVASNCRACLEEHCCDVIDACVRDEACMECLRDETLCLFGESYTALKTCARETCGETCYPSAPIEPDLVCSYPDLLPASGTCVTLDPVTITCNPMLRSVTCNFEAAASCDFDPQHTWGTANAIACQPSAWNHLCEDCGLVEGMCHFGLTCVNGRCGRFCCVDEDCGAGATCDPAWVEYRLSEGGIDPPPMGICVN